MEASTAVSIVSGVVISFVGFFLKRELSKLDETNKELKGSIDTLNNSLTGVRLAQEITKSRQDNADNEILRINKKLDELEKGLLSAIIKKVESL